MKTTRFQLLGVCISLFAIVSCQKDLKDVPAPSPGEPGQISAKNEAPVNVPPGTYEITLLKANVPNGNGTFTWEWKFVNNNPGNGNNGTAQGLSHWSINPASCVTQGTLVSAGYSTNQTSWTNFTPTISPDPSQNCITTPVIKFDFGTNGSAPSYYRLIVNKQFGINENAKAWYKSGKKTGCGFVIYRGMACDGPYTVIGGVVDPHLFSR